MLITLHKNARTTPAIRAEIAASNESTRALAKRFGVSELTIAKWRKRASVNDLPHTLHRLQTTLSPALSHPARLQGRFTNRCGWLSCQRFIASKGVLLPKVD